MRIILLFLIGLLSYTAGAQSLGRLPGTVYPSDRGSRTTATLSDINTARGTRGLEWYFDGAWPITADFTFKSNDVVHMLPGSSFVISTNTTLSFAGAEFWATKQRCFTGGGTTDGTAKYPHLFPEWSGGWSYGMTAGYLDPPYAYSNIYSSVAFTNLAGDTNLLVQMQYVNDHLYDWNTNGFATTNSLNSLSNWVSSSLSNMAVTISNSLVNSYQTKTASFDASAGVIYGCDPNGGAITITPPADPVVGNVIQFFDALGTATAAKPIVLVPNTKTIMGSSEPYTNSTAYSYQRFIYTGAGSAGWRLF